MLLPVYPSHRDLSTLFYVLMGKCGIFRPPAALPDFLTLPRIYAIIMAIMRVCDAVFAFAAQTVNLHTE